MHCHMLLCIELSVQRFTLGYLVSSHSSKTCIKLRGDVNYFRIYTVFLVYIARALWVVERPATYLIKTLQKISRGISNGPQST